MSDLISREEVFDILRYLDVNFANSFDWHTLNEVRKLVEELPSVENKGEWIKTYPEYEDWNTYECSCCGEEFCLIEGTPYDNGYNFCPNCGADMRGKI